MLNQRLKNHDVCPSSNSSYLWVFQVLLYAYLLIFSALASSSDAPLIEEKSQQVTHDMAFNNGRVIDPETGLDAIRNVGITGGKITAISRNKLNAKQHIDVSNKVVSAGFIDIHNHSPSPLGFAYQAQDGVTTSLELEVGASPIKQYGGLINNKAAINYGASAGYLFARTWVMSKIKKVDVMAKEITDENSQSPLLTYTKQATDIEIAQIKEIVEQNLKDGAIGIGLPLDYISIAVSDNELAMLFTLSAQYRVPIFVHIRRGIAGDPAGLDEILAMAKKHNSQVHICHLSHSAMHNTNLFLSKIRSARKNGVKVTTEVLPYNAGSTSIGAAVFGRDWQTIFNITYEDIQLAETGEWLTKERFEQVRKEDPSAAVIHHYVKEDWTSALVQADDVIVSSDGLPVINARINVPPQGIGSFSKILGQYVRDESKLSMMSALNKMSFMPAQLLQSSAPLFKFKGRMQVGMDADINIFDPKTIKANTSYEKPHQASTGMTYVLVNGVFVVKEGLLQEDIFAGQRILGTPLRH